MAAVSRARGCVLLEEHYDERNLEGWWHKLEGDGPAIEAVINHLHLWDVFDSGAEGVPNEALMRLGEILVRTWRCAAAEQFPGRSLRIELSNEADDYGPTISVSSGV